MASSAPPIVRLGRPWPVGAAHPVTGWREPMAAVRLDERTALRIVGWGDAVPGGYNGGFAALDPASSAELGRIEYHSADESVLIAWIEVAPALRGRGLADLLLARLAHEFPGARISAGLTTPSGTRWWQRVSRYVRTA